MNCLLCGSDEMASLGSRSRFAAIEGYQDFLDVPAATFDRDIVQCAVCGFQSIHPMYSDAELGHLYGGAGYRRFMNIIHPRLTADQLEIWRRDFVALGVPALVERARNGRPRFLDVGCGLGRNMTVFHELGFDVHGLDVNHEEVAYVRDRLGFAVHNEELAAFARRGETFDCVLASHFIEHVQDPHRFFETVLPMIGEGGMLLVETPLASDFSGTHAERFKDVYHTLFFDHFTLGLAGELHGAEASAMRNVLYFAIDGSFNFNVQVRYERAGRRTDLARAVAANDYPSLRRSRRAYDGLRDDALSWARSHQAVLQASRLSRGLSRLERKLQRLWHRGRRLPARIRKEFARSKA